MKILLEYSRPTTFIPTTLFMSNDGVFPGKLSNYHATLRLHRVTDGNRYNKTLLSFFLGMISLLTYCLLEYLEPLWTGMRVSTENPRPPMRL